MAQVVAAVEAAMADPRVVFQLGRRERNTNSRPPRVCFLPQGGPIEAPDHSGGRHPVGDGSTVARQLYKRELGVRVECWGNDLDQAEQLYENTLAVMRRELGTSFAPGDEEWEHEKEENANDVILGALIAFTCAIHLPSFDAVVLLKPDATISHVGIFQPPPTNYGAAGVRYGDPGLVYGKGETVC